MGIELQASLFDLPPRPPVFHGPDLEPEDTVRLTKHLQRCIDFISDGHEWTLREMGEAVGCLDSSASARKRQLCTMGYNITKRRDAERPGVWLYRLEED